MSKGDRLLLWGIIGMSVAGVLTLLVASLAHGAVGVTITTPGPCVVPIGWERPVPAQPIQVEHVIQAPGVTIQVPTLGVIVPRPVFRPFVPAPVVVPPVVVPVPTVPAVVPYPYPAVAPLAPLPPRVWWRPYLPRHRLWWGY